MPTQTYSNSQGWIPQSDKTTTTYISGLVKTEQTYICASNSTPSLILGGLNVFPDPILRIGDDGFTRAVVISYEGQPSNSSPYTEDTKVLKTGTAIHDNVYVTRIKVDDGWAEVPALRRETYDFQYLSQKINKLSATIYGATTPSPPSGDPEITILTTPFSGGTLFKAWKLVSYQATNYGNIDEVFYSHEGAAIYYKFTNNTSLSLPPPPVPQP